MQERLLLIVHLKHQRQRMTEMRIVAMTARPEAAKELTALLESYQRQLFPGSEKEKQQDTAMEDAKRALASETKKLYMVKKLDSLPDLRASIQQAVAAGSPELAKAAAMELHKKEQENLRIKARLSRMKAK